MLGNFLRFYCRLLIFFKINLFKRFFQEHYQSVKKVWIQIRTNVLSILISEQLHFTGLCLKLVQQIIYNGGYRSHNSAEL